MSEAFVPLVPPALKPQSTSFVSMTGVAAAPNTSPAPAAAAGVPALCAKPKVTLQRSGDRVTAIRIQCGCGQVIELNCTY